MAEELEDKYERFFRENDINIKAIEEAALGGPGTGLSDYYTKTEVNTLLDALETPDLSGYATDAELSSGLAGKASTSHNHDTRYYTQTQIDSTLSGYATDADLTGKANSVHNHDDRYYTETEINSALSSKLEASDLVDHENRITTLEDTDFSGYATDTELSNGLATKANTVHNHDTVYYTKTQIDSTLGGYATTTQLTDGLSGKSDTAHNHDSRYYTETEVNNLLTSKADSSALTSYYTKIEADALLDDKVSSSVLGNYYTSAQTDALLVDLSAVEASILDHETRISTLEDTDFSGYATDAELTSGLATKADTSHNHDASYYTKTQVDSTLADYTTTTQLNSGLSGKSDSNHTHDDRYYTETEVNTALSSKADTSALTSYYTKTEADSLLSAKATVASLGNYYTSAQTDTLLGGKQAADSDLTAIAAIAPSNDDVIQRKAGAWTSRTMAQMKTDLSLTKSDVGLSSVDNTSDAGKPVSTATQTALDGKQTLDSDLTAIAAISPSNDDVVQRKAGVWTNRSMAQVKTDLVLVKADVGLGSVDNTADASKPISSATQTALDGKQTLDSDLTAFAALAPTDNDVVQRKSGAWTNRSIAQLKTDLSLTKTDVGLSNVDNTSDSSKPVSTATQTALDGKQTLDSDLTAIAAITPTNDDIVQRKAGAWINRSVAQFKTDLALTKTDVGLANVDNTSDASKPISSATQTALDAKQALDSDLTAFAALTPTNDDIVQRKSGAWTNRTISQLKTDLTLVKADVGLSNVDNTSDASKPISTATQTALDGKQTLDSDLTAIGAIAPSNDDIIQRKSGAWTNRTVAQFKTDLTLTKSDVGLSNADNTSDANKPVSTATQTALNLKEAIIKGNWDWRLRRMSDNNESVVLKEYLPGLGANATSTIVSIATGNAGVIEKLKIISSGEMCQNAYLRISYDNGSTFPFVAELGTLFGSHYGKDWDANMPVFANCQHVSTQQAGLKDMGFLMEAELSYPIPFTNGIVIQLHNPTGNDYSGATIWSEALYVPLSSGAVPALQLRCTGVAHTPNSGYTNLAFGSGGWVLTSPNVAMNGPQGGYTINIDTTEIGQLAYLTGKGVALGFAYMSHKYTDDLSFLERNFGWYIDGATAPVRGGTLTTPTDGTQPNGTKVGSPTWQTSGTEDTFDTSFYSFALTTPNGPVTAPTLPSSTTAYTNKECVPMSVYISGGVVTAVSLDGTTTGATGGHFTVRPKGTIAITYSSAPTWKWFSAFAPPGGMQTSFSKPSSMLISNGTSRLGTYAAYLDLFEYCGGLRYTTQLELWLLTESRVTSRNYVSWCLLYYADLS